MKSAGSESVKAYSNNSCHKTIVCLLLYNATSRAPMTFYTAVELLVSSYENLHFGEAFFLPCFSLYVETNTLDIIQSCHNPWTRIGAEIASHHV